MQRAPCSRTGAQQSLENADGRFHRAAEVNGLHVFALSGWARFALSTRATQSRAAERTGQGRAIQEKRNQGPAGQGNAIEAVNLHRLKSKGQGHVMMNVPRSLNFLWAG